MRILGLLLVTTTSVACGSPEGSMLDTDGSSGTDGSSDSSDGVSASSASASVTMTAGMTSSESNTTASSTNSTAPTTSMTTGDPNSASSTDPADTSTGDCPPGELDCPCDIGSTCSGELVCEDGTCVAEPSCDEPEGEPNDDEASAAELPGITCGGDAMTVEGAFDGAESDWFRFEGLDAFACLEAPAATVSSDVDVAVCMYIACDIGSANVGCSGGANDDTSPDGLEGCCGQGYADFGVNPCTIAGSGTVFIRLTSTEPVCAPYELEFEF